MKRHLINAVRMMMFLIYRFFRAFPRKRRIVCLSRESDRPTTDFRLIRHYVRQTHPDYSVVILAKKLHNPVRYGFHMIRQLYFIATSQAVLLDTYAIVVSLLAGYIDVPVIQMWHALGNMKKFGYTALGSKEGRKFSTASLLNMHRGYTSVLISSKSFISDYARGFDIDPSIIYEAPLPRTDLLINSSYRAQQRERIIREFPELGRKLNIVYCPTFRKKTPANQTQAAAALADAIDYDKYNLIVKCHPLDDLRINNPHVFQHYPSQYDMLFVADYVISDYSTVIYEAGLLDLPVFLYAYDWPDYSKKRNLYIDPKRDIPTLFTDDAEAIVRAIEHDDFDHAAYQAFIRRNVAIPEHGSCTARVVEHVFDLIAAR